MNADSKRDRYGLSALELADRSFRLLVTGPDPLSVDGAQIGGGLPPRQIPLDELRSMLLHPAMSYTTRDMVWRVLIRNARGDDPAWLLGAVGVALPALRQGASKLTASYDGDSHDIDAEVLTAFVNEIKVIDISEERLVARLAFAAYNAGRRLRRREAIHSGRRMNLNQSIAPVRPWGHPDFVLAKAVQKGVISRLGADLIGRTRLENESLAKAAAANGMNYTAAQVARWRAEQALVQAIRDGKLADETLE
jgi:hypothetical protein